MLLQQPPTSVAGGAACGSLDLPRQRDYLRPGGPSIKGIRADKGAIVAPEQPAFGVLTQEPHGCKQSSQPRIRVELRPVALDAQAMIAVMFDS